MEPRQYQWTYYSRVHLLCHSVTKDQHMELLDDINFKITTDEVLHHAHLTGADADITQRVRELVDQAHQVAQPKAVYDVLYVTEKTEAAVTIGKTVFASRVLRINLDSVECVFPYVATCGTELEQIEPASSDMIIGYCLDIIKQAALNAAITHLQEHLTGKFALGQTSQMNPGSLEDWPITEQFKLFELLGNVEELAGVRLTDSCLMIPAKSLSGIIFPTEVRFESCQLCQRENCPSRQTPYDPQLSEAYGIPQ